MLLQQRARQYYVPVLCALMLSSIPLEVFAHQPRIIESIDTIVTEPAISKAYYGQLEGEPHTYRISSDQPFNLYVNVLVPDIDGQKKDVSAVILRNGGELAVLDGVGFSWRQFFEEFGHDMYWKGPEFHERADAGEYEIRVWSSDNDSKYALAIGETEQFDLTEGLYALGVIPYLKRDFFNESPIGFILSPLGWGLIVVLYACAGIVGTLVRFIPARLFPRTRFASTRNLGTGDRIVRILIAIALLLIAITTSWNPLLIFISGFAFFEALSRWCVVYTILHKNTCPRS